MMKNSTKVWLGWDLALIGAALGLVACDRMMAKDAFTALVINQVQILTPGDNCTVPGAPTSAYRSGGTLDLALPDGYLPPYLMPVVVTNNLASVPGGASEEMNNITLTHFTVELSAPGVSWNSSCPATFDTQAFSFLLAPGASTGAQLYAITQAHSFCLQPYVTAQHLVVTAKVWAKGRHGGTSIESAPYVYPIELCLGCLQQAYTEPELVPYRYPADVPDCAAFSGSGANPYPGDTCLGPGQDQTIFCCKVASVVNGVTRNGALCPGVFPVGTNTASSISTGL